MTIQEEDWANAIAYAEKGRILVKELESERGSAFPLYAHLYPAPSFWLTSRCKLSLDTALGVALVPYFSPKHHPRATRLLNGVLQDEPTNTEARFARALLRANFAPRATHLGTRLGARGALAEAVTVVDDAEVENVAADWVRKHGRVELYQHVFVGLRSALRAEERGHGE